MSPPASPCPDPTALERLFQGSLDAGERRALEAHLDGCQACAATVAALARMFGSASWGVDSARSSAPAQAQLQAQLQAQQGETDFGRYRLGRRLGAGGMGMVFEAYDPQLQRKVAIKLLYSEDSEDADRTRARLLDEARAMAQLDHPHVVSVFDVGQTGEQVFVAMELVLGGTLAAWLRAGPHPRATVLSTLAAAGRGLEAAHRQGLVHRDFKPDNVLIDSDGRPRVTDFGLATLASPRAAPTLAKTSAPALEAVSRSGPPTEDLRRSTVVMTERGAIVGTPAYMAPEQWRGLPTDARSDQFAFCVVLYEALFGARPFDGRDLASLHRAVLQGTPRPAPSGTPRWLRGLLRRGLAREPERRYPTLDALLVELERERQRWRLPLAASVGLGTLAILGTLAMADSSRGESGGRAPAEGASTLGPPACAEGLADARGRWSAARREALASRLEANTTTDGWATEGVEAYASWVERWTAEADRACHAQNQSWNPSPNPSPNQLDPELEGARARCLDAGLARFDATVMVVLDEDMLHLNGAFLAAARALPPPERCADPRWLAIAPAPAPDLPAARVALADEEIDRAAALLAAEQWLDARKAATRAVSTAEALGHPATLARARLVRAGVEIQTRHDDEAADWLLATIEACHDGAEEWVRAEALVALVELEGPRRLQIEAAMAWLERAGRLASRLEDPRFSARLDLARARVEVATGRFDEARTRLAAAAPILGEGLGEGLGPELPLRAALELDRAELSLILDGPERARPVVIEAQALALAAGGPRGLALAAALRTRARLELAAGRLEAAAGFATQAEKIPAAGTPVRHNLELGLAKIVRADIARARGDVELARELYEGAEIHAMSMPQGARARARLGLLRFSEGDPEAGETALVEALELLEPHWEQADPRRIPLLIEIGEGLLALDHPALAGIALDRAALLVGPVSDTLSLAAYIDVLQARVARARGAEAEALALLDSAHLGQSAGFGDAHPRALAVLLGRADLAWSLGDTPYAGRLYAAAADRLDKLGPEWVEPAARAHARADSSQLTPAR